MNVSLSLGEITLQGVSTVTSEEDNQVLLEHVPSTGTQELKSIKTEEKSSFLNLTDQLKDLEPNRSPEQKVPPTDDQDLKKDQVLEIEESDSSTSNMKVYVQKIIIQEASIEKPEDDQELLDDAPATSVTMEYDDLDVPNVRRQHKKMVTPVSEADRSPCDQGEEARKTWEHLQETAVRLALHCDLLQDGEQEVEMLAGGEISKTSSVDVMCTNRPGEQEDGDEHQIKMLHDPEVEELSSEEKERSGEVSCLSKSEDINQCAKQDQKFERVRRRVHFSPSTEEREQIFGLTYEDPAYLKFDLIEEVALEAAFDYGGHPPESHPGPEPNEEEDILGFISTSEYTELSMKDLTNEDNQGNPLQMGGTVWYDEMTSHEKPFGSLGDMICQSITSGFRPEETVIAIHDKNSLEEPSTDVPSVEEIQDNEEEPKKKSTSILGEVRTYSGVDYEVDCHHREDPRNLDKVDGSLDKSLMVEPDRWNQVRSNNEECERTLLSSEVINLSSGETKMDLLQNEGVESLKEQDHEEHDGENTECRLWHYSSVAETENMTQSGVDNEVDCHHGESPRSVHEEIQDYEEESKMKSMFTLGEVMTHSRVDLEEDCHRGEGPRSVNKVDSSLEKTRRKVEPDHWNQDRSIYEGTSVSSEIVSQSTEETKVDLLQNKDIESLKEQDHGESDGGNTDHGLWRQTSVEEAPDMIHSGMENEEDYDHGEGPMSVDKVDGSLEKDPLVEPDHWNQDRSDYEETSVSSEIVRQSTEETNMDSLKNEDTESLKEQDHGESDGENTDHEQWCQPSVKEAEDSSVMTDELHLCKQDGNIETLPDEGYNQIFVQEPDTSSHRQLPDVHDPSTQSISNPTQASMIDQAQTEEEKEGSVGLDLPEMTETQKEQDTAGKESEDREDFQEVKHGSLEEDAILKKEPHMQEMEDYTWYRQNSYQRDGLVIYSDSKEESQKDQNLTEKVEKSSEPLPYEDSESEVVSEDAGLLKAKEEVIGADEDPTEVGHQYTVSEAKSRNTNLSAKPEDLLGSDDDEVEGSCRPSEFGFNLLSGIHSVINTNPSEQDISGVTGEVKITHWNTEVESDYLEDPLRSNDEVKGSSRSSETGSDLLDISEATGQFGITHGNTEEESDYPTESNFRTENLDLQSMVTTDHPVDKITEDLEEEQTTAIPDKTTAGQSQDRETPLDTRFLAGDHIELVLDQNLKMDITESQEGGDLLSELNSMKSMHDPVEILETISSMNADLSDTGMEDVGRSNEETNAGEVTVEECSPGIHLPEELGSLLEPEQISEEKHYSSTLSEAEIEASDVDLDINATSVEISKNKKVEDGRTERDQSSVILDEASSESLRDQTLESVEELKIPLDSRSLDEDNIVAGSISDLYCGTLGGHGDLSSNMNLSKEVTDMVCTVDMEGLNEGVEDGGRSNDEGFEEIFSETVVVKRQEDPEEKCSEELPIINTPEGLFSIDVNDTHVTEADDSKKTENDPSLETYCDLISDHKGEKISESKKDEEGKSSDDASRRQFRDLEANTSEILVETGSLDVVLRSTSELSQDENDLLSVRTTYHPTEVISLVSTDKEDILDISKAGDLLDQSNILLDEQKTIQKINLAMSYTEDHGSIFDPNQEKVKGESQHDSSSPDPNRLSLDIVHTSEENVLLGDLEHKQMDPLSEIQSVITTDYSVKVTAVTSTVKVIGADEAAGEDILMRSSITDEKEDSVETIQQLCSSPPSRELKKELHEQDSSVETLTSGAHHMLEITVCDVDESSKTRGHLGSSDSKIRRLPNMDPSKQEGMEEGSEVQLSNEEALGLGQNKDVIRIQTEKPPPLTEAPTHVEASGDQRSCLVDHKEKLMDPRVEEDDDVDNNLLPHNTLDVSAQKSRVQLRRKTSIRRKQGQRQVTSESEPAEPPPPVIRPRPVGVAMFPMFAMAPAMTPEVPHHPEEEKEQKPAEEEARLVKPKKGIPRHAGFGIPHPQMMQELQARLKKKKPNE